jgi:hypothetical protein
MAVIVRQRASEASSSWREKGMKPLHTHPSHLDSIVCLRDLPRAMGPKHLHLPISATARTAACLAPHTFTFNRL